jgi:hypothetical protein
MSDVSGCCDQERLGAMHQLRDAGPPISFAQTGQARIGLDLDQDPGKFPSITAVRTASILTTVLPRALPGVRYLAFEINDR